ncbi:MAG: APC family permease [Paraglaciecola sp.]|uniref:APC family permease n=1 Tax=Paraglaciecola sp. TaxID=1920173 RepID=UPI003297439D
MGALNNSESKNSKLSLVSMIAICVGLVIVQGAMISALQGIGIGGSAFVLAMFCALIIAQCNAMSFAELALMFPQEGTLATYTQKALGHFPAIIAVFAGYVVVAILAIPVEMLLVEAILNELLPSFEYNKAIPIVLLGGLTLTSLIGADVFSKIQNVLAFVLIGALILVGLVAVTGGLPEEGVRQSNVVWSLESAWNGGFIGLIALAMWMMVGVEFICPMINQVKSPTRNIPLSMQLSLVIIFVIFLMFSYGSTRFLSGEELLQSPLPYLAYTQAVFGKIGLIIATILAITATCSTINTVLTSVPKMLHGMAENKQAFPQLKAINRYGSPWVAIVFLAVCTLMPYIFLEIDSLLILVIAATTSWLLAYIIAHIDVLVLRIRLPNMQRQYRTPFYPIPQIIGIIAMIYVALNNSPDPSVTKLVYSITGGILVVVSVIAALWVKLYMKKGLFDPDMD